VCVPAGSGDASQTGSIMSYRLSPARLAPMVALSLSCALGAGAAHAIPLLNGFGGPTGYGLPENCVHPNDDGTVVFARVVLQGLESVT
jgi:hypothetical protein